MHDPRETLFIVRTKEFDRTTHLLADRISAAGAPVVLVMDDRADRTPAGGFDTIPLSESRLGDRGFHQLPSDWRWLCGDLCYALAADRHPEFTRYAMIESDVWVPEDSARKLVTVLAGSNADAVAAELGPSTRKRHYSLALQQFGLDPSWGCLFPITCVTSPVLQTMGDFRRQQLCEFPQALLNDEAVLAAAILRGAFSHARLEDLLTGLVAPDTFQTNPPHLLEPLEANAAERRIFHPVVSYEKVLERIGSGEKAYSRHRLRKVLAKAPPAMKAEINARLESAGPSDMATLAGRRVDMLATALKPPRPIRIMDIGANPLIEGEVSYRLLLDRGHAHVTGFEPQEDALAALRKQCSAAETYLPYALGDGRDGTLHLTEAPGFASLYHPDPASAALLGFQRGTRLTGKTQLTTMRLDDLSDLPPPDFLKIDVQGSELAILSAGRRTLSRTIAIQTEVRMFPIYEGEPDRGELEAELIAQGFRFLRYLTTKHVALSRGPWRKRLRRSDFAQAVDGDAIYLRDLRTIDDWDSDDIARLALIADGVIRSPDLAIFALERLSARGELSEKVITDYLGAMPKGRLRF